MKAIVNTAPGTLEWRDLPLPQPGRGEARIRVASCGICATDLEMIAGWERTGVPAVPGHEWAGTVDAVGEDVDASLIGTACVAENIRRDGGEVGFEHDGGYAEFLVVEADCVHRLPYSMPMHLAPMIEPLAVAVRGVKRLRLEAGEDAVIFGDGPVGLLLLLLLRRSGAGGITLLGGRRCRLGLAEQLGADRTLNYHDLKEDLAAALLTCLPKPPRFVLEASGSGTAMAAAMDVAGHGGRILVIGDYGGDAAHFQWNRLLHGELELIGSNTGTEAWAEAVTIAGSEQKNLEQLVTHRLPAAAFAEGMALMKDRTSGAVKIVLEWEDYPKKRSRG